MTEHLGCEKHDPAGRGGGNSRNGTTAKTLLTDVGRWTWRCPGTATAASSRRSRARGRPRWRGSVSYLHIHMLVARHGQPGWVAALTPLSVDGTIVAASTMLLADSRSGCKGGALLWSLLVAGSVASFAANVAVAEPTVIGRVIAAWPSFALTASYQLLTRQVCAGVAAAYDRDGDHVLPRSHG